MTYDNTDISQASEGLRPRCWKAAVETVDEILRADAVVLDRPAICELLYTAADAATSGYDWERPEYRRN
jgi:hypothetical protein